MILKNAVTYPAERSQIADKDLTAFNNIAHALKAGDGYIFKSVKTLPETGKNMGPA